MLQNAKRDPVDRGAQGVDFKNAAFLRDMLLTLLAALLTGLSGGLLLILLVFGWGSAQADTAEQRGVLLQLRSLDGRLVRQAPLLNTDVQIAITGLLAWVRVEHSFSNPGQTWMEGRYQFPLPDGSAVERLNMQIGERRIEGRIEEKRQARWIFQKARASGRRASLLSQQRPNIFSVDVTNIAPGEAIRVAIEYQQRLHYADRRFELRFPLVIAPRYIPGTPLPTQVTKDFNQSGWAVNTDQVVDAAHITPPVIDPRHGSINPVSLQVRLDAGTPLKEVDSHYHRMVERLDEQGVLHLRLADGEAPADRDFVLSWRPEPGMEPRAALFSESWQGQEYALVMLLPPDPERVGGIQPREVIFVVDHSGSMYGASIDQAKAALRLSVMRLRPEDRFNLIGFNNRSRGLFSAPRPATPANLSRAVAFIDRLAAQGGTEMRSALAMALAQTGESEYLRQVVFLTDGSVGNEAALFDLIRQRLGDSRLFTVGIGSAPNSYFMQRAAAFGRGSFTYIGDLAEVGDRMTSLLGKLEHPAMSQISIDWQGGGDIEVEPSRLPDLYLGEPLVFVLKGKRLDGTLLIEGERQGVPWRQQVELAGGGGQTGVHAHWARQRIATLMAAPAKGEAAGIRRQAVLELALAHRVVSPYTSLVAVEEQPARPSGADLEGGMMPVNLPQGWHAQPVFGQLPQTASGGPLASSDTQSQADLASPVARFVAVVVSDRLPDAGGGALDRGEGLACPRVDLNRLGDDPFR
ncbi:MAG: marine proteobacterial sortase target protein [Candidatus Thiodiazotropha sp. (ex Dulcina madagascariensis)]|nr:marine proteobacterial sortase target protein [Candidatus Thiodiazotropha sp. (ex Dulcina madagascariensis)]